MMRHALLVLALVVPMGAIDLPVYAQTTDAPPVPSAPVPVLPGGPLPAALVLPGKFSCSMTVGNINLLPDAVEAIVRTQSPDYLMAVARTLMPRPQDFTVGKITGGPGPSAIPVQIHGRVVETACRVELRIDDKTIVSVEPRKTMAGFPKVWTWDVPTVYHDGKTHRIYARAYRCSTGTLIGPLDNAKAASQWPFTIGAGP